MFFHSSSVWSITWLVFLCCWLISGGLISWWLAFVAGGLHGCGYTRCCCFLTLESSQLKLEDISDAVEDEVDEDVDDDLIRFAR